MVTIELDATLLGRFPAQRTLLIGPVAVISQAALSSLADSTARLSSECAVRFSRASPDDFAPIRHWRDLYKAMGAPPSHTSSIEQLLRSYLRRRDLPTIAPIVDFYNWLSLRYLIPMAAYDSAFLSWPMQLRIAAAGEPFGPLGRPALIEQTSAQEVVYSDQVRVICRYWNYRDCHHTRVREGSNAVVFLADLTETMSGGAAADANVLVRELESAFHQPLSWKLR